MNDNLFTAVLLLENILYQLLFRFPLREDDLEHEEEDHHGHSSCDKRYKDVIDRRRHICRRNRHPQIVKPVADQGDHDPCDKIPHCLIRHIPMALKGDIPLQREVDALCYKRTHFVADKVSKTASDQNSSRLRISQYIISQQAPCKLYTQNIHMYLRPHEFRACKLFSEDARHKSEEEVLDDRHAHAEHEEIEDLVEPFCQLRMFLFKIPPYFRPAALFSCA